MNAAMCIRVWSDGGAFVPKLEESIGFHCQRRECKVQDQYFTHPYRNSLASYHPCGPIIVYNVACFTTVLLLHMMQDQFHTAVNLRTSSHETTISAVTRSLGILFQQLSSNDHKPSEKFVGLRGRSPRPTTVITTVSYLIWLYGSSSVITSRIVIPRE